MIRNVIRFFQICLLLIFIINKSSFALSVKTHEILNEHIANNGFDDFSLNDYLNDNLGFLDGVKELVKGRVSGVVLTKEENKPVFEWIMDGGLHEDKPRHDIIPYIGRSINHFHDPLNDTGLTKLLGISSTIWMMLPVNEQEVFLFESFSWWDTREYLYNALTSKSLSFRAHNFSAMFRGLGHLMHLVQDASVPSHARLDVHYFNEYEGWVESQEDKILSYNNNKPILFKGDVIENPTSFIDTNQYDYDNPDRNVELTTRIDIGLSEYTSANFFSNDTITNSEYPYPLISNITKTGRKEYTANGIFYSETFDREYYVKNSHGETNKGAGYLLAAVDYYDYYRKKASLKQKGITPGLDSNVFEDYAKLLIPRAIGYSAGLLKHFFRGSLDFEHEVDSGSITITNKSDKDGMNGVFTLYYDADDGTRQPVEGGSWTLSLGAGSASNALNFTEPTNIDDSKRFILVFKGQLGNEPDAVVGKVISSTWQKAVYEGFEYFVTSSNSAEWAPGCQAICETLYPTSTDSRIDTCNSDAAFFSFGCMQGVVPDVVDVNSNTINYGSGVCQNIGGCSTSNTWQNNVWTCSCSFGPALTP